MSEISALMGLYGAIDRAVVDDRSAAVVARYLGPYEHPEARGWHAEFVDWATQQPGVDRDALVQNEAAALRELVDIAPTGYSKARRLLVIAVAGRLFPDHRALLADALAPGQLTAENSAEPLLELLLDDDVFGGLHQWENMVEEASARELIASNASTAAQLAQAPCSGEVVVVPVFGGTQPAAALTNHFCTADLTFEQAKGFLHPTNWPTCGPIWCSMTPTGTSAAGNPTFHEVVSLDCDNKGGTWTAEACLEFTMVDEPDLAILSYDLCKGRPKQGDMVLVDEGSLTVERRGPGVCVETTKRILFNHPFTGPGLAMLACALGYGSIAEDLVFSCALGDPKPKRKKKFGAPSPPAATAPLGCDDLFDEAGDAAKQAIDECLKTYQASYAKVRSKTYRADDLASDMAGAWTRMVRYGAAAVSMGVRAGAHADLQRRRDVDAAASAED